MKYLKYFENIDSELENNEPEIKEGQEWISKDLTKTLRVIKVENYKGRNINVVLRGGDYKQHHQIHVDKNYILDDFNLVQDTDYGDLKLDFYKTTYIPEDKSIIGAYFIADKNDKTIKLLNVKENIKEGSVFFDNTYIYRIIPEYITLPASQVQILSEVEYRNGFFYIKIPYWLYKKNMIELEIKRKPVRKRYSYHDSDLKNPKIVNALKEGHLLDYMKYSNFDLPSLDNIKKLKDLYDRSLSK